MGVNIRSMWEHGRAVMAKSDGELPELLALIPSDALFSDRINAFDFSTHYLLIKKIKLPSWTFQSYF